MTKRPLKLIPWKTRRLLTSHLTFVSHHISWMSSFGCSVVPFRPSRMTFNLQNKLQAYLHVSAPVQLCLTLPHHLLEDIAMATRLRCHRIRCCRNRVRGGNGSAGVTVSAMTGVTWTVHVIIINNVSTVSHVVHTYTYALVNFHCENVYNV